MRGPAALLPTKNKLKQVYPFTGSWGNFTISTPRKQMNDDPTEGERITKEKAEPTVAFSRPPPLPPVFGPLIALSLLETWLNRDRDDIK